MSIVVCKLPKAGLGNQLFPLMKALVFAKVNQLPILVTGYHQLKIGPYLRGEKSKRKYIGFFKFEKNILTEIVERRKQLGYSEKNMVEEPDIIHPLLMRSEKCKYLFYKMPHWDNYFDGLRENRLLVKNLLWEEIKPDIKKSVDDLPCPVIGVHIRMGDFRKLKESEDFASTGAVRTPEQYFVQTINAIREVIGIDQPVSVFTDGFKHELEEVLSLKNVSLIEGNSDLVDLLLLSKSKIIVTSAGSTFSYWAGFLSEAVVIMHHDHCNTILRNDSDLFEGDVENFLKTMDEQI